MAGDKKPLSGFGKVLYILVGSVLFLIALALIVMLVWIAVSLWNGCNCAAAFSCDDCSTYLSGLDFARLFGCTSCGG